MLVPFGRSLSLTEHKGLVIHLPLGVISPPLRAVKLHLVPTFCFSALSSLGAGDLTDPDSAATWNETALT